MNDENVLQVSTDGLNVIKKFVKKYSAERKKYDLSELFSIGTHGLHVVNGWKIEKKRKLSKERWIFLNLKFSVVLLTKKTINVSLFFNQNYVPLTDLSYFKRLSDCLHIDKDNWNEAWAK